MYQLYPPSHHSSIFPHLPLTFPCLLLQIMGTMGLLVNAGIIVFASQMMRCYSMQKRCLIYLAIEHGLFIARYALEASIGTTPRWIADEIQRHDFIEDKHVLGAAADDSDEEDAEVGDEEEQRLLDEDELHIDDDKYVTCTTARRTTAQLMQYCSTHALLLDSCSTARLIHTTSMN
jgi:hypothetical protein